MDIEVDRHLLFELILILGVFLLATVQKLKQKVIEK